MAETTLPELHESKEEAHQKIQARIEEGQELRARQINSDNELHKAAKDAEAWSGRNNLFLFVLFGTLPEEVEYVPYSEYVTAVERILSSGVKISSSFIMEEKLKGHRKNLDASISSLESIRDRLELYDEPSEMLQSISGNEGVSAMPQSISGSEVFIVHGHDDEAKETVARFVENFGIEATILHEQANRGQTIPEKFEEHASEAAFAIILLTPDDVGASKDERDNLKPRARQNVVLELGYFWGRLGRERVCVLYKEGVELPSDMQGLLYVPMDISEGWKLKLAREMKQAGLPIDPEKLL